MKSDLPQMPQQAMIIARESISPKDRQSNLSAFLKNNHPDVPPVVYHGTADDITQFQHNHPNKKDAGWLGKGFYFTNNKSIANSYSMLKHGNNENVMPIHLSLKNPFQATMEHKNAIKQKLFSGDQFAPSDFTDELISKGHDGVVLNYGDKEGTKEYVVFNPTQIKSAIGNSGNYDPTHPDITKAKGGMVSDPKKAARAALHVARHKNSPNRDSAPRNASHHPAVAELKHLLTMHRDELRRMKGRAQYDAIDGIMKRISHEHGISPSKLHDDWMSVYHQTPDAWVAGDHGSIVDRALKMTNRGKYAGGGAPASFAPAAGAFSGAPIDFAPAASAFTGLPLPKGPDIAPSAATRAAILASRPTTRMGSGKPLEMSKYIGPSIPAPTFDAASYGLPKTSDEALDGGFGGVDRWNPDMGGATAGGGALGGGGPSGETAARGGRMHRANDDRVQHALSLTRHAALPGRQHTRGRP